MKLFLASLGITEGLVLSFKKLLENNRHLRSVPRGYIIENASDYKGREGQLELRQYYMILKKYGIDYQFLDLKKYKNSPNRLKTKLDSADFIYISGGNTFYLYYWVVKSGLDQIIKDQISNGLVYAGSSAGSVIAGTTLKYFDFIDKIEVSPEPQKVKWEGLNLVNFVIFPHWGVEKYKDRFNKARNKLEKDGYIIKTLTNKQAFLVIDGKLELIEEK